MRKPQRLFELLFLLALIAGLAFLVRRQEAPTEDHTYLQLRLQFQREFREGKLEACLDSCNLLLSKEPGDLTAVRYLGLVSLRQGRLEEAEKFFDGAIASVRSNEWSQFLVGQRLGCLHRDRARLRIVKKDWKGATDDARKALELLNSWEDDYKLAEDALVCALAGSGEIEEARSVVQDRWWWGNDSIHALASKHSHRLDPETELYTGAEAAWHPLPCPLCP